MSYFITTTKKVIVEGLVKLFKNNIQKLHMLPRSMTLDKGLQFAVRLMKKLNKILEIETKLLIVFHLQTDKQMEKMN